MLSGPEIEFASQAVQVASQLVRSVQAEMLGESLTKDDRSPVTVGDFVAQAVVARLLASHDSDIALVGEESAAALRDPANRATLDRITGFVTRTFPDATNDLVCQWIDRGNDDARGRFWTLDPIDGTKGFLRGDQYAVALALIDGGEVQLGVLGCPNLAANATADIGGPGTLFLARRGEGSWAADLAAPFAGSWQRIHVSDLDDPSQARLLRSVEAGHTHGGHIDQIAERLRVAAEPVRMDSQAKYAALAAGGGDAILRLISPSRPNYREKIWDQAAGSIVVEEAGGRVTDLDGKRLDFRQGTTLDANRGVLVSNARLHEPLLAAIAAVGA